MSPSIAGVSIWLWALIVLLLLAQGTWLFTDARRRGAAPWFWGIWGLIQFPFPLLMYWMFVRLNPSDPEPDPEPDPQSDSREESDPHDKLD